MSDHDPSPDPWDIIGRGVLKTAVVAVTLTVLGIGLWAAALLLRWSAAAGVVGFVAAPAVAWDVGRRLDRRWGLVRRR